MRLNQFIAETGICSRREADRLIESGAVTVNGAPAVLGMQAGDSDTVTVNGQAVGRLEKRVCILLNKPVGIVSTTDTRVQNNIIDFVGYPTRLFTVGRLDKFSEGAILLTNDGNYVNRLLRSEFGHEKVYRVQIDAPVTADFITAMSNGVRIFNPVLDKNVTTKRCDVQKTGAREFEITLTQGFNRQIRRMCQTLGHKVTKLKRIRFLFLKLDGLKPGEWRELTLREMGELDRLAGINRPGMLNELENEE